MISEERIRPLNFSEAIYNFYNFIDSYIKTMFHSILAEKKGNYER